MVVPLSEVVAQRVRAATAATLAGTETPLPIDPQIRPSEHADLQADGLLALGRTMKRDPRELAKQVADHLNSDRLNTDDVIASCQVAGPGFLNLTLTDRALLEQVAARSADTRLGIPRAGQPGVTVVDYSQPNIAKQMHVGHLRSTVIGDALVRLLEFAGHTVVRRNHLGDWGTQFGMLIQFEAEHPDAQSTLPDAESQPLTQLDALYRAARVAFERNSGFAQRARQRVVALQSGDPETRAAWSRMVAQSTAYFTEIYQRLGVLLTEQDAVGESFYNSRLPEIAQDLEARGIAVHSDGALSVFFDDITGPNGSPVPLIIRKSDGGYGYAATDLAALRHRVEELGATRLLYVVDARQALHFQMVFATARRAGYLPDHVEAVHVAFGTVLGPDGRPFKTRSGGTVALASLLDEAVQRAHETVQEKNPGLDEAAVQLRAQQVGIGAVKYADLSTGRTRDYRFDPARMLALSGDTGVYLQYAHARVRSILANVAEVSTAATEPTDAPTVPQHSLAPAERRLALLLDGFADGLDAACRSYEPHRFCGYLYALAQAFTAFYGACPVIQAPDAQVRANRTALCRLTADTLALGLDLLGIQAPPAL
jgi:arginyl-tRNA synthetase